MVNCPGCGSENREEATACLVCGDSLKQPKWWRKILIALIGENPPPAAPRPPAPIQITASSKNDRIALFTEWIGYEDLIEGGIIVLESDRGCYVQFALGTDHPGAYAEIGTTQWEEIFGAPLSEPTAGRLAEAGFQPPEIKGDNYWLDIDDFDARSLAVLTEWAFREIFGEDENFTAKVATHN